MSIGAFINVLFCLASAFVVVACVSKIVVLCVCCVIAKEPNNID